MLSINTVVQEQLNTLLLPVLSLIGLAAAVVADPYLKQPIRRIMLLIDIAVMTLIINNCLTNMLETVWKPSYVTLKIALSVYSYIMRPAVIVLFIYIVWDNPKRRLFWILVSLNAAVFLTAFFRPWTFSVTEEGLFQRGALGYTAHGISFLLLSAQLIITLIIFRDVESFDRLFPVINVVVAVVGPVLDSLCYTNGTITFAEISEVFCSVFFYIWLHLQFVRAHEQMLISEQRIQIMMSQIQPHFLYNTLSTIQALCLENPKKAATITERFATYLRQNIDSLNEKNMIPFRKELDHTLVYTEIELERFPNVHLDYEIEDEDFLLPALTVQPIVENAIRHGVRGTPRGQIDIITNLLPDSHEIIIRDNGKGFSQEETQETDGPHIGIQNVRERLQKLCGGTMKIESEKGRGTCVTIRIPRGKERL